VEKNQSNQKRLRWGLGWKENQSNQRYLSRGRNKFSAVEAGDAGGM